MKRFSDFSKDQLIEEIEELEEEINERRREHIQKFKEALSLIDELADYINVVAPDGFYWTDALADKVDKFIQEHSE